VRVFTPGESQTLVDNSTETVLMDGLLGSDLYRQNPAVFVSRGLHEIGRSGGSYTQ